MRKLVRTLCLVAMVALVATSCKKKEESTNITVALEEVTGFEAGPSIDGSKAYIDPNNYQFKWNEGDAVVYYNLSSNWENSNCAILTAVNGSEGKTRTQFEGSAGPVQDKGYFVFYHPGKSAGAASGHTQGQYNRETFTVPATQTFNKNYRIDPSSLVMACRSVDLGVFSLQHIFGILNIGIYKMGDVQVESITVTDDNRYLAGDVNLKLDEVDADKLDRMINYMANGDNEAYQTAYADYVIGRLGYNATGVSKTITLTCDAENGALGSGYNYFFISLRPGALYNGFTVTINYVDGPSYSHHFDGASYLIKPGYFTNIFAASNGLWYYDNAWH